MPIITIQGKERSYIFSVVPYDYRNMPDCGGIYLAVNATENGLNMENCIALGACSSFKKYQYKILSTVRDKCTHLYLMPQKQIEGRAFALEDLMLSPAFQEASKHILEQLSIPSHDELRWYIEQAQALDKSTNK